MKTTRLCAAVVFAVRFFAMLAAIGFAVAAMCLLIANHAHAADRAVTRAYLMNGLFGWALTNAMPQMGAQLRARGAIVTVGSWTQEAFFAADACRHRGDRIVFIGHSLGGPAAARAAITARACGVRSVRVVSIDPPRNLASSPKGVTSTNFVGVLGGQIAGARNVSTPGYSHIGIVNNPKMQSRIVSAAMR
jgi:pimeloyl-ACP methyl ester carboxylesterase